MAKISLNPLLTSTDPATAEALDRISRNMRRVQAISALIDYSLEKNAEHNDGPKVDFYSDCLLMIDDLVKDMDASAHGLAYRNEAGAGGMG